MTTKSDLLTALQHGYEGYINNGHLTAEDLPQYAEQLKEDLDWIGLSSVIELLPLDRIEVQIGHQVATAPIAHYKFGQTHNNINNADPQQAKAELEKLKNMEGPGLDREDLRWTCDVFRNARRQLPGIWLQDECLRKDLANPKKHIDCLHELFWLSLWQNVCPDQTVHEHKTNASVSGTVDWKIVCDLDGTQVPISLEVKNLSSSLELALFGGADTLSVVANGIQGLRKKFPLVVTDEIHVVCISTFLNVPKLLDDLGMAILEAYKAVDAVFFWIAFADHGENTHFVMRQQDEWQNVKNRRLCRCFKAPGLREGKPFLYSHPLWGALPWQQ